jgi:hypothetical protein
MLRVYKTTTFMRHSTRVEVTSILSGNALACESDRKAIAHHAWAPRQAAFGSYCILIAVKLPRHTIFQRGLPIWCRAGLVLVSLQPLSLISPRPSFLIRV